VHPAAACAGYVRTDALIWTPPPGTPVRMAKRRAPPATASSGRAEKSERPVVIGARVRELYEAKGWSQMELAWRANLSLPKISRVVTEKQGLGCGGLLRLVMCLNTSADYLLGLTDDPLPRSR
jgi:plasmid maintenance system antidote protein VapI